MKKIIIVFLSILLLIPGIVSAEEIEDNTDTGLDKLTTEEYTIKNCTNQIFNRTLLGEYKNVFIVKTNINDEYQLHLYGLKSDHIKYKLDTNTAYYYFKIINLENPDGEIQDSQYIQYVYYTCNTSNTQWELQRYGTYDLTSTTQNLHAFSLENKTNTPTIPVLHYTNHNLIDINGNIIRQAEKWPFWEEIEIIPDKENHIKDIIKLQFDDNYHKKGAAITDVINFENIEEILIKISNINMNKITKEIYLIMPNWIWYFILSIIIIIITFALIA